MIKALEEGNVTNILLMDDDVEVSPESIIRTFNLLSITNEKYSEAFVSGSMMNYDEPDQHWEDTGHMTVKGNYMPDKPPMRVSALNRPLPARPSPMKRRFTLTSSSAMPAGGTAAFLFQPSRRLDSPAFLCTLRRCRVCTQGKATFHVHERHLCLAPCLLHAL